MSQLTKSFEVQATVILWDKISLLAKSAMKFIFDKDTAKLQTLTEKFVQSARDESYPIELIDQLLAAAGQSVINASGEPLKQITEASFDTANIARLIGVGFEELRPKDLLKATDSLQSYALSTDHQKDGNFTTDGRAHLILAMIAIIGRIFAIKNPNQKIQWLKLTTIFIEQIIASPFIHTNDWHTRIGKARTTFFEELSNLQTIIQSTITHLEEKELLRPALIEYIETINVQIDAAQFNTGAVMGIFWQTTVSNMANGRPRVSDLNPPTLIGYFIDAMGGTLPPPSDSKKKKETPSPCQPKTQQYMESIIAQSKASSATIVKDTSRPGDRKKPLDKKYVASNLKHAEFLSAFEDLINIDRIRLEGNGNVVLYAYQKPEEISNTISMGINTEFLKLKKKDGQSQADHEAAEKEHRKNILKAEVFKARTMNAVLGLIELCDCTRKFQDDYGMVKSAIFLQKLFPSILTLIKAASRQHDSLIGTLNQLKRANPQIAGRIAERMSFFRRMADNLKNIKNCAEKGQEALAHKLEDVTSGKSSMERQLTSIRDSLENCHNLFSASNMLDSTEASSLQKDLEILQDQIKLALPFDESDRAVAKLTKESMASVGTSNTPNSRTAATSLASLASPSEKPPTSLNNFPEGLSDESDSSRGLYASPFQPLPTLAASKPESVSGSEPAPEPKPEPKPALVSIPASVPTSTSALESESASAPEPEPASASTPKPEPKPKPEPAFSTLASTSTLALLPLALPLAPVLVPLLLAVPVFVSSSLALTPTKPATKSTPKPTSTPASIQTPMSAPTSTSAPTIDSKSISPSVLTVKDLIATQADPITALFKLVIKKDEDKTDLTALRKFCDDISESLQSADKSLKVFNSPQIFKFGLYLCKKFNPKKDVEIYKELFAKFPQKISKIIIAINNNKKFIFNSKKKEWTDFNLYVTSDWSGFFRTGNEKNERGNQAQIILEQIKDTEFFRMSSHRWPKHFLYVYGGVDGTVKGNREYDSGAQAHFSLTPHDEGEYFTLATEEWPRAKLYISNDAFGFARCKEQDKGDRSYIGLTPFEEPAQSPKK